MNADLSIQDYQGRVIGEGVAPLNITKLIDADQTFSYRIHDTYSTLVVYFTADKNKPVLNDYYGNTALTKVPCSVFIVPPIEPKALVVAVNPCTE